MPLLWRCMYEGFANKMRTLCVLTVRATFFLFIPFSLSLSTSLHCILIWWTERTEWTKGDGDDSAKESMELSVTKFIYIYLYECIVCRDLWINSDACNKIVKLYANVFFCSFFFCFVCCILMSSSFNASLAFALRLSKQTSVYIRADRAKHILTSI